MRDSCIIDFFHDGVNGELDQALPHAARSGAVLISPEK
jgi:hypothetical protein